MDSKIFLVLLTCLSVTNSASKKPKKVTNVIPPNCEVLPPRIKETPTQSNSISLADDVQHILNDGALKLPLKDHLKSAILILGNTGSGKTTVSLTMNANLSTIHAKSTESGQIVIVDEGEKIGHPSTKSKTLIPNYELSPDKTVAFYDCPGFNDNRGPAQDIAAMYFIKSIVDQLEQVKFLLTIQYGSMHLGGNKNDFLRLLKHATNLLQNPQKFNESIGLIVTKVPNYDEFGYRQDASILAKFKEFLEASQEVEEQKVEDALQAQDHELSQFHQRQLKFINILLATDEEDDEMLTKVSFVRNPPKCGSFKDIPAQLKLREKLTDFYNHSLTYANVNAEDFGFTLKDSTIVSLKTAVIPAIKQFILDQTNSQLISLEQIYFAHFNKSVKGSDVIRIDAIRKLNKHLHQLTNLFLSQPFHSLTISKKVSEIYRIVEVSAPTDYIEQVERRESWLESLLNFTHSKSDDDGLRFSFDSFLALFNDNFQNVKQDIRQTYQPDMKTKILQMLQYALDATSSDYFTLFNENLQANDMTRIEATQKLKELLNNLESLLTNAQFKSLLTDGKISEIYSVMGALPPADNLTEIRQLEEWRTFYKKIANSKINQDLLGQSLFETFKNEFSNNLQKVKQTIIKEYLPNVRNKIRELLKGLLDSTKTTYFIHLDNILEESEENRIKEIQKLQNHSIELANLVSSNSFQSLSDSNKIPEICQLLSASAPVDDISTIKEQEEVLKLYQELADAKADHDSTLVLFNSFQNEFNAKFQSVTNTILKTYAPGVKTQIADITKQALNAASKTYFDNFHESLKGTGSDLDRIKEIRKLQNYLPQLTLLNSSLPFQSFAASKKVSQLLHLLEISDSTLQIAEQEEFLKSYEDITHSTFKQDISELINSFLIKFNDQFRNAEQKIIQVYLPDVKNKIMELIKDILDNASKTYLQKYNDQVSTSPENDYTSISAQIKCLGKFQPNDMVRAEVEKIVTNLLGSYLIATDKLQEVTDEMIILNDYESISSSKKIITMDLLQLGLAKARINLEDKVAELKIKLQNDVIPGKLTKLKSSIKSHVDELWTEFEDGFSEDYFDIAGRVIGLRRFNNVYSELLKAKEAEEFGVGNRQDVKTNLISLSGKMGLSLDCADVTEMENDLNKIRKKIELTKEPVTIDLFFSSLFTNITIFRQKMIETVRDNWKPTLLGEIRAKLAAGCSTNLDLFRSKLIRETMSIYLRNITLDLDRQPINVEIDPSDKSVLSLYDKTIDKADDTEATLLILVEDEQKRIKKKLEDQRDWYGFVVKLDEKMGSFEAQNILKNDGIESELKANILDTLNRRHFIHVPSNIIVQEKSGGSADTKDLEILRDVINYAVEIKTKVDCMIGEVTGRFVMLSDYINKCGSNNFTVLASDTLFIDANVERRGGSINIIARNWVVTSETKISLDGRDLSDYYGAGAETEVDGCRGKPGLPGGNFFGVYDKITKAHMLTISAIGGKGGGGQRGGNGRDGSNGRSATKEVLLDAYDKYNAPHPQLDRYEVKGKTFLGFLGKNYDYYEKKGEKGTPGRRGGNGGQGGQGGNPGYISIGQVDKIYSDNINIKRWQGPNGISGDGGKGGNGGKDGNNYRCYRNCGMYSNICDWYGCETLDVSKHAVDGSDGSKGSSSKCHFSSIPSSRQNNYWTVPVNRFLQLLQSSGSESSKNVYFANNIFTNLKRKDL